jgi:hypothetical protein
MSLPACGASEAPRAQGSATPPGPQYASEPFTPQQELVAQGAHLIIADGCEACHLTKTKDHLAPSFESFAGHLVTLADGRRVLVDEHFLREGLLHPRSYVVKGYDRALMLTAVEDLHLSSHPEQVAALSAFIEEIGPESG